MVLVSLAATKLIWEEVVLDVGLLLEKLLLLEGEEASLADVLSLHELLNEGMEMCGGLDLAEVDEGVHYVFDLIFVLVGDFDFLFEKLDEVLLLEW